MIRCEGLLPTNDGPVVDGGRAVRDGLRVAGWTPVDRWGPAAKLIDEHVSVIFTRRFRDPILPRWAVAIVTDQEQSCFGVPTLAEGFTIIGEWCLTHWRESAAGADAQTGQLTLEAADSELWGADRPPEWDWSDELLLRVEAEGLK